MPIKTHRVICFALGLGQILLIAVSTLVMTELNRTSAGANSDPNILHVSLALVFNWIYFGICAVTISRLAKKLKRSALGWGVFGFITPLIAGIAISLLGEPGARPAFDYSGSGFGGMYTHDKKCSNCGRSVSLSSAAGQRCPHCGAYWSFEEKKYL